MPEGKGYGPQDTASIGKNLNVIGNHAYAFSGVFGTSNSEFEMLNFKTGAFYTVGRFTCNGAARIDLVDVGAIAVFQLKLNGIIVLQCKVDTNDKDSPSQTFMEVVLPPYTEVILSATASENTDTEKMSVSYTGKIYK